MAAVAAFGATARCAASAAAGGVAELGDGLNTARGRFANNLFAGVRGKGNNLMANNFIAGVRGTGKAALRNALQARKQQSSRSRGTTRTSLASAGEDEQPMHPYAYPVEAGGEEGSERAGDVFASTIFNHRFDLVIVSPIPESFTPMRDPDDTGAPFRPNPIGARGSARDPEPR